MKKILNFLLFGTLLFTAACNKKTFTAKTVNDATTEDGTIRIHSNGLGKSQESAYNNAIENAFSMLLFKGIPESIQSTPMVPDENSAKQQYAGALECFKDKNCYSQFITKSSQEGDKQTVQGGYQVTSDVTINVRALRTYLENKVGVRKFGF